MCQFTTLWYFHDRSYSLSCQTHELQLNTTTMTLKQVFMPISTEICQLFMQMCLQFSFALSHVMMSILAYRDLQTETSQIHKTWLVLTHCFHTIFVCFPRKKNHHPTPSIGHHVCPSSPTGLAIISLSMRSYATQQWVSMYAFSTACFDIKYKKAHLYLMSSLGQ